MIFSRHSIQGEGSVQKKRDEGWEAPQFYLFDGCSGYGEGRYSITCWFREADMDQEMAERACDGQGREGSHEEGPKEWGGTWTAARSLYVSTYHEDACIAEMKVSH